MVTGDAVARLVTGGSRSIGADLAVNWSTRKSPMPNDILADVHCYCAYRRRAQHRSVAVGFRRRNSQSADGRVGDRRPSLILLLTAMYHSYPVEVARAPLRHQNRITKRYDDGLRMQSQRARNCRSHGQRRHCAPTPKSRRPSPTERLLQSCPCCSTLDDRPKPICRSTRGFSPPSTTRPKPAA